MRLETACAHQAPDFSFSVPALGRLLATRAYNTVFHSGSVIVAESFKDLSEREILALAMQLEEEDSRTAKVFKERQAEESRHRQMLIEMHRQRFGEHIPLIRRKDVKGFIERRPVWLVRPLGINAVRKQVETMELETRRFYERALSKMSDAATRKLLGDLAEIERQHSECAESLEEKHLDQGARAEEEKSGRGFLYCR